MRLFHSITSKQSLIEQVKGSCYLRRIIHGRKVKGGALYVSILVSIVIGILLSLFILAAKYNQRNATVYCQSSQLFYNLKSAFQVARSAYFTSGRNYVWMKNQVNDDSIRVKKINWGAYLLICAETKNRHQYLSQSGIFGTHLNGDTGLMISDNSRPVGLSGNIIFRSGCYLPRAGTKPAYIEGQNYTNNALNSLYTRHSPGSIPLVNNELIKDLKEQVEKLNPNLDSAVVSLARFYDQPFSQKTIVWENPGAHLSKLNLSNNIKIICEDIEIDSSAHLENVLIICNKARFKKGFRGKIHVIASDSISMEESCEFSYPSSFVLLSDQNADGNMNSIQFNRKCKFYGGILALHGDGGALSRQKVFVKLNSAGEVNGFIYSANYIHLEGIINAMVIADKLLLKTPSAVYENHMLGCEINPAKYAGTIGIPLVFDKRAALVCCESIN